MKLIVISYPTNLSNELEILCSLFEAGLECFHVYKPSFSEEEIQNYIHEIPSKYHNKIVLHSDYLKFHSLKEIENCKEKYEYAFLSPIFDSISKTGYKSGFKRKEIKEFLKNNNTKIIALGGIDENTIQEAINLGFDGAAVLGAIWMSKDPLEKFINLQNSLKKINAIKEVQNV
ncbi:MAG: thiamine phosphate synthase [Bacteroidia bacterium]